MKKLPSKALRVALSAVLVVGLAPSTIWAQGATDSGSADSTTATATAAATATATATDAATASALAATTQTLKAGTECQLTISDQSDSVSGYTQYGVGKFTAPAEGIYTFYSSSTSDTYGYLYSDAALSNQLAYDDDSGESNNFSMTQVLDKGEVVYLVARFYSSGTGTIPVTVGQTTVSTLTLDATTTVSVPQSGYALAKFTAPSTGTFKFTYNDDDSVNLYTDASCSATYDSTTTYGDDTATRTASIDEGQSVYLRISDGTGSAHDQAVTVTQKVVNPSGSALQLGKVLDFAMDEDEDYTVGVFTAPSAGMYTFYSEGSDDTYGYLYSDSTLQDQLAYNNDSGSGENFLIAYNLSAGQKVYLKAGTYGYSSTDSIALGVTDQLYLSSASVSYGYGWVFPNETVLPTFTLTFGGNTLVEGTDYTFDGYYSDYSCTQSISAPTTSGYYYVKFAGKGSYSGEKTQGFSMRDGSDISNAYCSTSGSAYVDASTGTIMQEPTRRLYFYVNGNDRYLTEGVDYEFVRYVKWNSSTSSYEEATPNAEGTYYAEYAGKGSYTGTYRAYTYFNSYYRLYVEGFASDSGALYSPSRGNVLVYTGSTLSPKFVVEGVVGGNYGNDALTEGVDYEVTFEGDLVGSATETKEFTATFTGLGTYAGYTTSHTYSIVPAIDLSDYASRAYLHYGAIGGTGTSDGIEFQYTGKVITPTISIGSVGTSSSYQNYPKLGTHYTMKIMNAAGTAEATPKAKGSYIARLTAVEGSGLTGTLDIPFKIVENIDLDPFITSTGWSDGSLDNADLVFSRGSSSVASVPSLFYGTTYSAVYTSAYLPTYGLDYTTRVEKLGVYSSLFGETGDSATDNSTVWKIVEEGIGAFTGSIAKLVGVYSASEELGQYYCYVNGAYAGSSYSSYSGAKTVYTTAAGTYDAVNNTVTLSGLVQDVDFTINNVLVEKDGSTYLEIVGMGDYEGGTRLVQVTDGGLAPTSSSSDSSAESTKDLSQLSFYVYPGSGVVYNYYGGAYHMLKSSVADDCSNISKSLYNYSDGSLPAASECEYTYTTDSDGKLTITAVPTSGSSWTGSVTSGNSLYLDEVLDISGTALYVGDMRVSSGSTADIQVSSDQPAIEVSSVLGATITTKVVNNATGKTASLSSLAEGSYTITATGTGSYTGSTSVTVNVTNTSNIPLNSCAWRWTNGNSVKYTGEAVKPAFTLTYNGVELVEGTDYTVEYGNNVEVGFAYAKATAIDGSGFVGYMGNNFDIVETDPSLIDVASATLTSEQGGYSLGFSVYNSTLPTVTLSNGAATLSGVRLTYSGAVIPSNCYKITYANNTEPGMARVTVTGIESKGYTGSATYNFLVKPADGVLYAVASTAPTSIGETGTLACTVLGLGDATATYQWQYRKSGGSWTAATANASAKTAAFSVLVNDSRAANDWRCVVTASDGRTATSSVIQFDTSSLAALTATASTEAVSAIGQTGTLSCAVEGLGSATAAYQWMFSSDGGSTWSNATANASAKTANFSVAVTKARAGYLWKCVVTANDGRTAATDAIQFEVTPAAALTATASTTPIAAIGKTGTLSCAVEGLGSATAAYQWQYRASSTGSWANATANASAKTANFSVTVNASRAANEWRCVVTASDGRTATTDVIQFEIAAAVTATASTTPVALGATAKLTCSVSGNTGTPAYQWQYRTSSTGSWSNATATGNKTATLSAALTATRLGYDYRCKVTVDGQTVYTDVIRFEQAELSELTATATTEAISAVGDKGTLSCAVDGLDGATATYQWQYRASSTAAWANATANSTAKTAAFTVTVNAARAANEWRCVVTASDGRTATTDVIKFRVGPSSGIGDVSVGDYVTFGSYEQDNDTTNG